MLYVFIAVAAVGHAVLWVATVNRVHSVAMNKRLKDVLTAASGIAVVLIPLAFVSASYFAWRAGDWRQLFEQPTTPLGGTAWGYLALCAVICVVVAGHKLWLRMHPERRGGLLMNHTTAVALRGSVAELAAPGMPRFFARLPGNEIFRPQLHEKQLAIARLPLAHEGLRIAHLTDLHISGRISKSYFEQIVEVVNDARPDLIAVTGDILERDRCLDWIPETLGRLRAPRGVYFVLGNHDRRVDVSRLKAALAAAGLVHLGGQSRWLEAKDVPRILLAGNELPWQGPAPSVPSAPSAADAPCELRILLAHTPDQFAWAQEHGFDLVLAGHNHGGQVCAPLLGPILVPSRHGTRYANGVFTRGDTVLHVSRGTSSLSPVRYNCPPEVAILVLRRDT